MDVPVAKRILRYMGSDFFIEVAKRRHAGHSSIHKFGRNPSIGTGSFDTLWAETGRYVYPANASTMTLSSDSANDVGGGSGARTVKIDGLDAEFSTVSEVVSTNSSTPVTTANAYSRVHRLKVTTAGASSENSGTVYLGNGTVTNGKPANVYGSIDVGKNQSQQLLYTIPKGKTGLLIDLSASSSSSKEVQVELVARPVNEVFQVKDSLQVFQTQVSHNLNIPDEYASKTDIEVRAKLTGGANDVVAGHIEILLVNNELIDNLG